MRQKKLNSCELEFHPETVSDFKITHKEQPTKLRMCIQ